MQETSPLRIFSARRKSNVLLDPSGSVTTLERLARGMYRELDTYVTAQHYAEAVPEDTPDEYLQKVDAGALLDYTDHYYQKKYQTVLAIIGYIGIRLTLSATSNGMRFSTVTPREPTIYANESFLAVSPSIYYAVSDAFEALQGEYREELSSESY